MHFLESVQMDSIYIYIPLYVTYRPSSRPNMAQQNMHILGPSLESGSLPHRDSNCAKTGSLKWCGDCNHRFVWGDASATTSPMYWFPAISGIQRQRERVPLGTACAMACGGGWNLREDGSSMMDGRACSIVTGHLRVWSEIECLTISGGFCIEEGWPQK